MTIQKAIKTLDILIQQETILAKGMVNPQQSWNAYFECMQKLAKSLAENTKYEIAALQKIRSQIIPKCRHPKKMQDRCSDGTLYCMNCNWDL